MLTTGDLIVAEIARKTTEARWRVVWFRMCNKDDTPQRMRIDLKATHKWEEIRKIMIASGRGTDRIDVMIDLGEKKARKQLPPCFSITPEIDRKSTRLNSST